MAEEPREEGATGEGKVSGYSWYVLGVLVIVYVFNFIDRQILSILNEDIKADLGLSDASMGFLYGTAFAVFYAIFGIPLGRLADMWVRKSLISIGLLFWSVMTALSGTANNFAKLAIFRIGVGVGESSASPAAFSMLGDYFPPRLRATAVAIYSSGVYIGSGIGIFLGGLIVDNWNEAYPSGDAPFGLVGWQAAFFAVGIPGIIMALWVWSLKEPVRGQSEGLEVKEPHPAPFQEFFKELGAVVPPFTLFSLAQAGGASAVVKNLGIMAACTAGAVGMTAWLVPRPWTIEGAAQWIALGVGLYAFFSWVQGLAIRDRGTYEMIYKSKAIVFGMIGFAWIAFVTYGLGYWVPPFFQRVHGVSASEAGMYIGLTSAAGGLIGVSLGGFLSDLLKQRTPKARPYMGLVCCVLAVPAGLLLLTTDNPNLGYVYNFIFSVLSPMWIGSAVALANELVMPRMRATASAYYILAVTFIGLALGPFTMGQLSTTFAAGGMDPGDALRRAMLLGLIPFAFSALFLWMASRHVEAEEASRLDRAQAVGEEI